MIERENLLALFLFDDEIKIADFYQEFGIWISKGLGREERRSGIFFSLEHICGTVTYKIVYKSRNYSYKISLCTC